MDDNFFATTLILMNAKVEGLCYRKMNGMLSKYEQPS